jgi:hypothetical protein
VGKIGSGLDVRGAGGYVLLPPSVHPDGAIYRWKDADAEIKSAPSWLLEKITSPAQRAPIAADISILPQGRRNDGLTRLGGALRRKGAAQAEIETALRKANERRCRPALPDAEIRKIAESVSRYLPGGPDSLETAWRAIQNEVHPSRYTSFLALCRHLQAARPPGFPIALPLERIGSLMACHWTQVRRWRRRAVSGGQLRPVERYVKKRKAAQYAYVECPTREENTCPTREDVPLRSTTSGLVGQSEKSPSGTVKQISLRAQGGRISTFPHCPRCASHALYRKNNVGNYECQSCGLQDIGESAARRTQ